MSPPARTADGVRPAATPPAAVLFDRDGTLVHDLPYNGDPERVRLRDGAADVVARLRKAGVAVGLVTNQSGIARGTLTVDAVEATNRRVSELVGGFDVVEYCPHGPEDGCRCRKPRPGMIERAAARLGVDPSRCVVIGDIGSDVEAALAAGAGAVLVPTAVTLAQEVPAAPLVAGTLQEAVSVLLGPRV